MNVINISDLLNEDFSDDGDEESDGGGSDARDLDDFHADPVKSLDLGGATASYVRGLREALGEAQFGQLCATLGSEEERTHVAHLLA